MLTDLKKFAESGNSFFVILQFMLISLYCSISVSLFSLFYVLSLMVNKDV